MKSGDIVHHPELGKGTIETVVSTPSGPAYRVKFPYAEQTIPASEFGKLGLMTGDSVPKIDWAKAIAPKPSIQTSSAANSPMIARAGINALKLGQILESQVKRLTVGTDEAESEFDALFSRNFNRNGRVVMIEGAWGVGKTHLLTLLAAHASDHGYAVSSTILDGYGATLSDPMRLMESITSSIKFPGEPVPMGIGAKLSEVKSKGLSELRAYKADRLVKVLEEISTDALTNPEAVSVLEDYLGLSLASTKAKESLSRMGYYGVKLPPLKAQSVKERGDRLAELLCDWAAFCVGGKAKGLLVVLDEVDVDYARAAWWDYQRRSRQDLTLKALGAIRHKRIPLVIAFGSAPAGPGAQAANDAVQDVMDKVGKVDAEIEAKSLTTTELTRLGQSIHALYDEAYPGFSEKLDLKELSSLQKALLKKYQRMVSPVPRRYVRALLHCMDAIDLGTVSLPKLMGKLG